MEWIKDFFRGCCRLWGMMFLVAYLFALRIWFALLPLLSPFIHIFQSIDLSEVALPYAVRHCIKGVMLICILWWQAAYVVVLTLLIKPLDTPLKWFWDLVKDLEDKYRILSPYSLPEKFPSLDVASTSAAASTTTSECPEVEPREQPSHVD